MSSHYSSSSTSTTSSDDIEEAILLSESNTYIDQYMYSTLINPCIPRQPRHPRQSRYVIHRDRQSGHQRLFSDYFSENPTYSDQQFRRRFRMQRHLFVRIMNAVTNYCTFFQQKPDASGRMGLSPLQKCTVAIRTLAYGVTADAVDDYIRIGETTGRVCLEYFVHCIVDVFGNEYLRRPTTADLNRLLSVAHDRGFPCMIGSIDCMHWQWKNCPRAWHGQYARGDHGKPTLVLEAVAGSDTWIWHSFFGCPGTQNDINVLDKSPVFDDIFNGKMPPVEFKVNGNKYELPYYLTDGIYPKYATFVKSIPRPQGSKAQLFATYQERYRKDVERAFEILQARFAIVRGPTCLYQQNFIGKILRACIIMHNMIVEDEGHRYARQYDIFDYDQVEDSRAEYSTNRVVNQAFEYIQNIIKVRDRQKHSQLQADLVEHIWEKFRSSMSQDNS